MASFAKTYLELAGRSLGDKLKKKRRPKLPRSRAPRIPLSQEREYARELRKYAQAISEVYEETLLPRLEQLARENQQERPDNVRTDAAADEVFKLITRIPFLIEEKYSEDEIRRLAQARGIKLSEWNKETIGKNIKKVIGIDPLFGDQFLANELATFTAFNVSLAKSLKEESTNKIASMVYSGFQKGQRAEDLAKEIRKHIDPRNGNMVARANLIARDQINKLNGALTEQRQSDLGVRRYRWRTMGDALVRGNPNGKYPNAVPSHWAKDGEIFSWDDPPPDTGHPGQDYQCRCYAEPILEDLVPGIPSPEEDGE